jgi:hypothetical protein
MTMEERQALALELERALERLESALDASAGVVAELRKIVPGLGAESVVAAQPSERHPSPIGAPAWEITAAGELSASIERDRTPRQAPLPIAAIPPRGEALTTFQLAFESTGDPLDLRAVDEAVSAHPAVRDVALMDYDGQRATLKVWIAASARPADVQDALRSRTAQLFTSGAQVSVLALNGVA